MHKVLQDLVEKEVDHWKKLAKAFGADPNKGYCLASDQRYICVLPKDHPGHVHKTYHSVSFTLSE